MIIPVARFLVLTDSLKNASGYCVHGQGLVVTARELCWQVCRTVLAGPGCCTGLPRDCRL
jgi:hypothetical protein